MPNRTEPALREALAATLEGRGYAPTSVAVPRGYEPHVDERIAFALRGLPEAAGVVAVPETTEGVFRYARWLSATLPEQPLAGWQRLFGLAPVVKYFLDGRPQWRDGTDDDLEVDWEVPTQRPAGLFHPAAVGLPTSAAAAEALVEAAARPYAVTARDPGEGELLVAWIDRRSRLAS